MITILLSIARQFIRMLLPASRYPLFNRSLEPLSAHYGYDRGSAIDRYYIELFLSEKKPDIKGVCMEITDDKYLKQFGGKAVVRREIVDINPDNKLATIHGDLRHIPQIQDNTFDCIVLTHVLGMIDDMESAVSELYRILKPKGVLLFTGSTFSPAMAGESPFWRFTVPGVKYLFGKYFSKEQMSVRSYGNVLSGQGFWVGMSQQDLKPEELAYNDPRFPCIITLRAVK